MAVEVSAMRGSVRALLLVLALGSAGCGKVESAPSYTGQWTSRPKEHSESKEAVEFFGESAVQRLHELGNAITPPIELDLRPDGRFEAHGRLTPSGDNEGRASGSWKQAGSSVRLTVEHAEGAPGLPT